ncbi:MAG: hypothetical protein WCO84_04515 [bacterium]
MDEQQTKNNAQFPVSETQGQTQKTVEMPIKPKFENESVIKKPVEKISSLRTYKEDFDTLVKEKSISIARMTIMEEARSRELTEEVATSNTKKYTVIGFSLLLMLTGVGFGVYAYFSKIQTVPINIVAQPKLQPEIVYAENKKQIEVAGLGMGEVLSSIKKEILEAQIDYGKIENIQIVKKGTNGGIEQVSVLNLFSLLNSSAPGDLVRSLGGGYMLGVVNPLDGNRSGMLIIKVDSYQNAFAGMLGWEKGTMLRDIYEFIRGSVLDGNLLTKNFEDLVVGNQDSRILKNDSGEIVMVYGFLNNKTIAIAGNLSSFNEIIARFRNSPN